MKVENAMSKNALTCGPADTLDVPAMLMWQANVGAVPVIDPRTGALAGIITDRDICMAGFKEEKPLREIAVSDAMTKQVFYVHATDSIETAEQLMRDKQVRRLAVLDVRGSLAGILSIDDIAREASLQQGPGRSLSPDEIVATYAAVTPSSIRPQAVR